MINSLSLVNRNLFCVVTTENHDPTQFSDMSQFTDPELLEWREDRVCLKKDLTTFPEVVAIYPGDLTRIKDSFRHSVYTGHWLWTAVNSAITKVNWHIDFWAGSARGSWTYPKIIS